MSKIKGLNAREVVKTRYLNFSTFRVIHLPNGKNIVPKDEYNQMNKEYEEMAICNDWKKKNKIASLGELNCEEER